VQVKKIIVNRQVGQSDDVPTYISFVKRWGGGVGGRFIKDLHDFHVAHMSAGRIIATTTFGSLADLKVKINEMCPFFVVAVVKAQGACHRSKVSNKVCRFITSADITSLDKGRKKDMTHAEGILADSRKLITAAG
jgi:hypothetical protein